MALSVVIPALDEEEGIAAAIRSVRDDADEVIVVDGGSQDGTRAVAEAEGARILESARGRGLQLAEGAAAAGGDWLVFLHADTRLGQGWRAKIDVLPAQVVGGAFRLAIDAPQWRFRVVEHAVALRCALFHLPYGDQALFARRNAYARAGGFPPLPLMEDVAFVKALRRVGPIRVLRPRAVTSPRRWQRHGVLGTSARNLSILALYEAGISSRRLASWYR